MGKYISTFVVGFEEAVRDLLPLTLPQVTVEGVWSGAIMYETEADKEKIAKIPYLNNSYLILYFFKKVEPGSLQNLVKFIYNSNWFDKSFVPALPGARTFRVIASRENQISPLDENILRNIEEGIAKYTGLTLDRAKPDIEYWFVERSERFAFFGLRLTRKEKNFELAPGQLRPELANLLVLMSDPKDNDVFLDPFAGSGALAEAREKLPSREILSSDIKEEIDATNLVHIKDASVDKIVTDPPWGLHDTNVDIETLYKGMLQEFQRVLKKNGLLILLTSRKLTMEKLLPEFPQFNLLKKYDVLVNGKKAGVFKITKAV